MRQVFDIAEKFISGFKRIPKQLKDSSGHVGMANNIVLNIEQLTLPITSNFHEDPVAICNAAGTICFGDDKVLVAHNDFTISWSDFIFRMSRY